MMILSINFGHFFKAFREVCVFIKKKEDNVCFLTISNFSNNKKHKSCLSFFLKLYIVRSEVFKEDIMKKWVWKLIRVVGALGQDLFFFLSALKL